MQLICTHGNTDCYEKVCAYSEAEGDTARVLNSWCQDARGECTFPPRQTNTHHAAPAKDSVATITVYTTALVAAIGAAAAGTKYELNRRAAGREADQPLLQDDARLSNNEEESAAARREAAAKAKRDREVRIREINENATRALSDATDAQTQADEASKRLETVLATEGSSEASIQKARLELAEATKNFKHMSLQGGEAITLAQDALQAHQLINAVDEASDAMVSATTAEGNAKARQQYEGAVTARREFLRGKPYASDLLRSPEVATVALRPHVATVRPARRFGSATSPTPETLRGEGTRGSE